MRKTLLMVVALAVALCFTGVVRAEQAAPAQKDAKVAKDGKGAHPLKDLKDLTDKQKEEIKAIQKQAKADAEKVATPEEKTKIFKAAHEKIVKEVLTDKQRQELQDNIKADKPDKGVREARHEGKQHKAPSSQPTGTKRG